MQNCIYYNGKIIEWIQYPTTFNQQNSYSFQPLRITVCGKAGTGKSFLIHTITSMIRQMTSYNGTVILCGPTGASACNINGKRFTHSLV